MNLYYEFINNVLNSLKTCEYGNDLIKSHVYKNGAGAEIRTRVAGSTVP